MRLIATRVNDVTNYFSLFVELRLKLSTGRLRVVSNFGDRDCGAGEYTRARAREISRRRDAKGAPKNYF